MEKAYKLLAIQENISNKEAKSLIDQGLVSVKGKQIKLARSLFEPTTSFKVQSIEKPQILFEDSQLLALEKPCFVESYELCKFFPSWVLLHRLDQQTSGVILLVKEGSTFHKEAIKEFKQQRVYKEYFAILNGILANEEIITKPILTFKKGYAKSRISKDGLPAHSHFIPTQISGKKTLAQVIIKTGRTHQIRVHAKSIDHPIFGDTLYGGLPSKRLMLHAHKIALLGYELSSPLPQSFQDLMQ